MPLLLLQLLLLVGRRRSLQGRCRPGSVRAQSTGGLILVADIVRLMTQKCANNRNAPRPQMGLDRAARRRSHFVCPAGSGRNAQQGVLIIINQGLGASKLNTRSVIKMHAKQDNDCRGTGALSWFQSCLCLCHCATIGRSAAGPRVPRTTKY